MANSSKVTTGNMPRLLQLGVDEIIDHLKDSYKGVGNQIFKEMKTDKAFFEAVQLAGVGMASLKNEGSPISADSIDQNWVYRWPVLTYEKSLRFTMEAIEDNLYEDLMSEGGKQISKALDANRDYQMAVILNNAFATAGPDGKAMCATDHPIQAGGTSSNTVTLDISEDALEQMVILADGFVNPDGLPSNFDTANLVVPKELRFEADRIVSSKYRVGTPDNDINAMNNQGVIQKIIPWKRLTDTDAFFLTTNADKGLIFVRKRGVETSSEKEIMTRDVIVTASERFVTLFADWRGVVGSPGV